MWVLQLPPTVQKHALRPIALLNCPSGSENPAKPTKVLIGSDLTADQSVTKSLQFEIFVSIDQQVNFMDWESQDHSARACVFVHFVWGKKADTRFST